MNDSIFVLKNEKGMWYWKCPRAERNNKEFKNYGEALIDAKETLISKGFRWESLALIVEGVGRL